jgi:hypothetical protein
VFGRAAVRKLRGCKWSLIYKAFFDRAVLMPAGRMAVVQGLQQSPTILITNE